MKHKKVSDKHAMIEKFTEEALRLGGDVSANQRHFIKAALAHGKTMEPAGRLAGANRSAAVSDQSKQEAVTLSAEAYQALLDELEDLRIERVACDRIATVQASELLSLETMRARFR